MNNTEKHQKGIEKFVELANQLKNDDYPPQVVLAAMMTASGIYGTYIYAGNEGYLQDSGVDKLVNVYRKRLEEVQAFKKSYLEEQQKSS